jgi:hypothetical protein
MDRIYGMMWLPMQRTRCARRRAPTVSRSESPSADCRPNAQSVNNDAERDETISTVALFGLHRCKECMRPEVAKMGADLSQPHRERRFLAIGATASAS